MQLYALFLFVLLRSRRTRISNASSLFLELALIVAVQLLLLIINTKRNENIRKTNFEQRARRRDSRSEIRAIYSSTPLSHTHRFKLRMKLLMIFFFFLSTTPQRIVRDCSTKIELFRWRVTRVAYSRLTRVINVHRNSQTICTELRDKCKRKRNITW